MSFARGFLPRQTPRQLMQALVDNVVQLEKNPSELLKTLAKRRIAKQLQALRDVIYKSTNAESHGDMIMSQLCQDLYNTDLLLRLIQFLMYFGVEGHKAMVMVFNNVLQRRLGSREPTVEYVSTKPEILFALLNGLSNPTIAFPCGEMLRKCIEYEELNKIILYSPKLYDIFAQTKAPTYAVRAEVLCVVNRLLTTHQPLMANFFKQKYDEFFDHYYELLTSDNYVTRRMSIETLGTILLQPRNKSVMKQYVSCSTNLKVVMNLLLNNKSRQYMCDLFHVFKLFVVNPKKPKEVLKILVLNQQRLAALFSNLPDTHEIEDQAIIEEMRYLANIIKKLKMETTGAE
ncbi:protein Mo25-like [Anopheles ziemanni]|uniref:protein Mo25-like n=1 Tax=Anopheles coustani TaxID=139045 RepID=UPI00265A15A5|nr:protein Mo25-like [Anopheles coustani]XP_058176210.1 protein Mo25-like [Anopheles ziemanni]